VGTEAEGLRLGSGALRCPGQAPWLPGVRHPIGEGAPLQHRVCERHTPVLNASYWVHACDMAFIELGVVTDHTYLEVTKQIYVRCTISPPYFRRAVSRPSSSIPRYGSTSLSTLRLALAKPQPYSKPHRCRLSMLRCRRLGSHLAWHAAPRRRPLAVNRYVGHDHVQWVCVHRVEMNEHRSRTCPRYDVPPSEAPRHHRAHAHRHRTATAPAGSSLLSGLPDVSILLGPL
jgi:hypothetical protein